MTNPLADIEALTNWCRLNTEPPPSDILYAAVGALAVLRRQVDALDEIVDDARRDARLADIGARRFKKVSINRVLVGE